MPAGYNGVYHRDYWLFELIVADNSELHHSKHSPEECVSF